jgi:hypothetical protein
MHQQAWRRPGLANIARLCSVCDCIYEPTESALPWTASTDESCVMLQSEI